MSSRTSAQRKSGTVALSEGGMEVEVTDPQPALLHLLKPELVGDENTLMKCADLESLKRLGDELFNAVTVFGTAREGKSTLLNMLSGCPDVFKTASATSSCTQGVDAVFTTMAKGDDSAKAGAGAGGMPVDSGASFPVAWLDAEGSGHKGDDYDMKLVLPLLLLSKVMLFNTKNAPALNYIMAEAGKLVALMDRLVTSVGRDKADSDDEEDEEEGATFGHLFFVFRDFELEVDDLSSAVAKREKVTASNMRRLGDMMRDYSLCLGDVSVPSVKKRWEKMRPDEHGFKLTAKKVKEMETLRKKLCSKFASIQVWLLPSKISRPDEFREAVDVMSKTIRECLSSAPLTFAGRPGAVLTGNRVAALLPAACEVMNAGGDEFNMDSMFAMMQAAEGSRLAEACTKVVAAALTQLEDDVKAGRLTVADALAKAKDAAAAQVSTQLRSKLEALMLPTEDVSRLLTKAEEEVARLSGGLKLKLEAWLTTAAQRALAAACKAIDVALSKVHKAAEDKLDLTGTVRIDESRKDTLLKELAAEVDDVLKHALTGACPDDAGAAKSLDLKAALVKRKDATITEVSKRATANAKAAVTEAPGIMCGHDVVSAASVHLNREAARLRVELVGRIAEANRIFAEAVRAKEAAEAARREAELEDQKRAAQAQAEEEKKKKKHLEQKMEEDRKRAEEEARRIREEMERELENTRRAFEQAARDRERQRAAEQAELARQRDAEQAELARQRAAEQAEQARQLAAAQAAADAAQRAALEAQRERERERQRQQEREIADVASTFASLLSSGGRMGGASYAEPRPSYGVSDVGSSDAFRFGRHQYTGPLRRDGRPDMRYREAKDFAARTGYDPHAE